MRRNPHSQPSEDEAQAYADAYGQPSASVVQCHECGSILDSAVIADPHRPDCPVLLQAEPEAQDDAMEGKVT